MNAYRGRILTGQGYGYVYDDRTANRVIMIGNDYYVLSSKVGGLDYPGDVVYIIWGGYKVIVKYRDDSVFPLNEPVLCDPPNIISKIHECVTRVRNSVGNFLNYSTTREISNAAIVSCSGETIKNWSITPQGITGEFTCKFARKTPRIIPFCTLEQTLVYPFPEILGVLGVLPQPVAEEIAEETQPW